MTRLNNPLRRDRCSRDWICRIWSVSCHGNGQNERSCQTRRPLGVSGADRRRNSNISTALIARNAGIVADLNPDHRKNAESGRPSTSLCFRCSSILPSDIIQQDEHTILCVQIKVGRNNRASDPSPSSDRRLSDPIRDGCRQMHSRFGEFLRCRICSSRICSVRLPVKPASWSRSFSRIPRKWNIAK
jgi:hypothetical protein